MNRSVPISIVLVVCATLTSPARAETAATRCLASSSGSTLTALAPQRANQSLAERVFDPAAHGMIYLDGPCSVTATCPDGGQVSCNGNTQCSTSTLTCSDQGSTCPGQSSTVPAVQCDGVIGASCTCPAVCFGCNVACTTNADCVSACTCGSRGCSSGRCNCRY